MSKRAKRTYAPNMRDQLQEIFPDNVPEVVLPEAHVAQVSYPIPHETNCLVKRAFDAELIEAMLAKGRPHLYTYDEWRPWTGDGYIFSYYDVMTKKGEVIPYMRPMNGKLYNRELCFTEHDEIMVRLSGSGCWF